MGKEQRFNGVRILLLSLFLFPLPEQTLQGVVNGATCNAVCLRVCLNMGAGHFSQRVGIVNDIQGCVPMCMAVCTRLLFIPGVCFADSTMFLDAQMQQVNATMIKQGDVIQTLSTDSMDIVSSVVKFVLKIDGQFDFVAVHLVNVNTNSTTTLTVTEEHGVIILGGNDNTQLQTVKAKSVVPGQKMIGTGLGDVWMVQEVEQLKLPSRYVIQTEAGTALASEVLTTTSCLH